MSTLKAIAIVLSVVAFASGIPVEDDLTLTIPEQLALNPFRQAVSGYLTHDYMKADIYLIKWLRARNLNIEAAKTMLLKSLQWRADNHMDTILEEDYDEFMQEFPIYQATDYTGRPVIKLDSSQWDVRKAVVNGKKAKLIRFSLWIGELNVKRVRDAQAQGLNVTQTVTIINLKGFNLVQHACVQCMSVYINLLMNAENYYPGMAHKIITINTPSSFEVILGVLRPLMSRDTKQALQILGTKRAEWQRYLLNMIPADQLEVQFGGTKYE